MVRLLKRLYYVVRQRQLERELREELEVHRAMKQAELEARGRPPNEAALESRRALGNVTLAREDARSIWIAPWLESLWQDAVYAFRMCARQPGFTMIAGGALAADIGLNTSLFTVFSALALREWPVRDPHRIVTIVNLSQADIRMRGGGGPGGFSLDEVRYFSEHSKTFSGFVVTRVGGGDKTIGDDDVPASWVSGNYFSVLGVAMQHGRGFLPEEDRTDSPSAVAVISYGYWQWQLGADPSIVGRQIRLEDVPFTVVGVTARSFTGTLPQPVDIWLPLGSSALLRPDDSYVRNVVLKPQNCCSAVAGRLGDGVTREEAQAELLVLDRQYRPNRHDDGGIRLAGTQFRTDSRNATSTFAPMFTGSMLVLLIACANVANLLLARASARRREIGVRIAIGASRSRIIRQLLTESVILAAGAGVVGITIAMWLPAQMVRWTGADPGALQLTPDRNVMLFTVVLSVAASVVFGLLPSLHGARSGASSALKNEPVHRSRVPLRGMLLAVQVAVAVILLISAALVANAVRRIGAKDFGFDSGGVAVMTAVAPARGFDAARRRAVSRQLEEAVEGLPGVVLTSTPPLGSGNIKGPFTVSGDHEEQNNSVFEVSPDYFEFLQIPILAAGDSRPLIGTIRSLSSTNAWRSSSGTTRPELSAGTSSRSLAPADTTDRAISRLLASWATRT